MRRILGGVLTIAIALTSAAAIILSATPAEASSDPAVAEAGFVSRINSLRASKGLPALRVDAELTSIARSWSNHMAQAGACSHNSALGSQVTANWTKLGENVGHGSDVDAIHSAFVASSHHYPNMVDPAFTRVGLGVVYAADGSLYVTEDFEQVASTPQASSPAPAPAPVTKVRAASASARPQVAAPAPKPVASSTPVATATATTPAPAPLPPTRMFQALDELQRLDAAI